MYNQTIQDVEPYLLETAALRNERSGMDRYKKATVAKHLMHSANIPQVLVEKMRNGQCCTEGKSYDLSSPDRDEIQRALIHVQVSHPECMAVTGRVFTKKALSWR